MALFQERQIRGFWKVALIVEKMQNSHWFLRYQVNDRKIVLQMHKKYIFNQTKIKTNNKKQIEQKNRIYKINRDTKIEK